MLPVTQFPRLGPWLVLGGLIFVQAAAAQTPLREREPNPAATGAQERAAGIAPTPGAARREAQAEDQIYRQLLGQNPNAPSAATPPPPMNTPGQDARATDQILRELTAPSPGATR
ncbi:hypothetical protein [Sediminicoccus sp. KRV36]|uniref:hypothetical protein n=1 Tax=Sediminicoccus sp. KRV36 TaxID=3133721 RepID=UPI00200E73B6|nr:hypothetical protein [Sediminicoccus rosea]UPY39095.1 hypothetical protein LHU95_10495 [Sediminicoccus rosea]